jgi:hypothetical protein
MNSGLDTGGKTTPTTFNKLDRLFGIAFSSLHRKFVFTPLETKLGWGKLKAQQYVVAGYANKQTVIFSCFRAGHF